MVCASLLIACSLFSRTFGVECEDLFDATKDVGIAEVFAFALFI